MSLSQTAAFWMGAVILMLGGVPVFVAALLHVLDFVSDKARRIPSVKMKSDPWEDIKARQRQYRREEMADWDKRFKELLPEETQMQRIHRQRVELFDLRDMLEYNNHINVQNNNKLHRAVDF